MKKIYISPKEARAEYPLGSYKSIYDIFISSVVGVALKKTKFLLEINFSIH